MPITNSDRAVMFGAGLLIGLAVGMPVGALITAEPAEHRVAEPTGQQCEEDQPCWDCTTMGNRICGPGMAPPMDYALPVVTVSVEHLGTGQ
ncbi:hypothetical protein FDI64_gp59 [Mycobacterium phage Zemanar]|uniref:Uncharacterized protein n=4 Tax=Caudoviricetes TaxID=2731619 RepID=G1BPG9_9CAUD|nr:hypothetical protein FDI64_gp59 [Mycobacterium phage Zemanar]YP_010089246.1 hypothetical protein KNT58_gp59 [Mycobacterium phage Fortunato]QFG08993.1 hypothetical protein SEA_MAGPIE_57 [Mycobacterium phage Magpie]QJD51363.1 hypothetical protein SEA_RAWRGERTHAT_59 [Mycobacterium phage RawrgerThat]AEJ95733.1 hypothetical protein ZEMANAR_59 [Mycobacterium phage Zemanar]AOT27276.1 hypothetical protein SEA_FORTUNATO_59 [Mycobacterium phage Fortunato]